jgi:hypothetical protein
MQEDPTSEGLYLLDKKPNQLAGCVPSHNNCSNRMALRRRWFIQISALSAFDGRIEAYHGVYG